VCFYDDAEKIEGQEVYDLMVINQGELGKAYSF
jgi:hypothetical protein